MEVLFFLNRRSDTGAGIEVWTKSIHFNEHLSTSYVKDLQVGKVA
ncbi:MAG: hypothetical protein JWR38_5266 [Mucilaginibacter sp.]|nr:hypothetical protein [Mucilaginibacter sp.]